MDTINFSITEPQAIRGTDKFKSVSATITLGNETLPHSILNTNQVLAARNFNHSEFDLFTCSCGEPGCAGFQSPVVQNILNNTVSWIFPLNDGYKTKKQIYEFDLNQFTSSFENFINKLKELETKGIYMESQFDMFAFDDEEFEAADPIGIKDGVGYYLNKYKAEEELYTTISNYAPNLINKELLVIYDEETTKYSTDVVGLISSMLNQYPKFGQNSFYLTKATLAAKAIEKALLGDMDLFTKVITNSYANYKYGLNPTDFVERWFYNEDLTSIDLKKLKLKLKFN